MCQGQKYTSDPLVDGHLVSKLPGYLHAVFGELRESRKDTGKQGTTICHALWSSTLAVEIASQPPLTMILGDRIMASFTVRFIDVKKLRRSHRTFSREV